MPPRAPSLSLPPSPPWAPPPPYVPYPPPPTPGPLPVSYPNPSTLIEPPDWMSMSVAEMLTIWICEVELSKCLTIPPLATIRESIVQGVVVEKYPWDRIPSAPTVKFKVAAFVQVAVCQNSKVAEEIVKLSGVSIFPVVTFKIPELDPEKGVDSLTINVPPTIFNVPELKYDSLKVNVLPVSTE